MACCTSLSTCLPLPQGCKSFQLSLLVAHPSVGGQHGFLQSEHNLVRTGLADADSHQQTVFAGKQESITAAGRGGSELPPCPQLLTELLSLQMPASSWKIPIH